MESEDDGFPKPGAEPLDIGDEFDSEEEQEEGQAPPQPGKAAAQKQEGKEAAGGGAPPDVKGQKVANQPFDLAVDVNDSEEIDSDEEEDEVNVEVNPVSQQTAT